MALVGTLSRDVVLCIIPHLDVQDILNVSLGNWTLYGQLFLNETVWHQYVIRTAADLSWKGIKFGDISWKELVRMVRTKIPPKLRKTKTRIQLSIELRKIHLRKRLEAPQSSKDYLQPFLKIFTNSSIPEIIIPGKEYYDELSDNGIAFSFAPRNGSTFLVWIGEGNNYSKGLHYWIDRRSILNLYIEFKGKKVELSRKEYYSTLSKKDYSTVGQLLYNNPNFYEGTSSSKYNWDTSHGYHRSGNAPSGMGSSTREIDKPNLSIKCIKNIVVTYSINALYQIFINGVNPSELTDNHFQVG